MDAHPQLTLPTVWTNAAWPAIAESHTRRHVTPAQSQALVLSIFPGIDLLGSAFETAGFCIVRGPDPLFGGDIRNFTPPANVFTGIIGGPPCQDFSKARRSAPTGYGLEMLAQFARVVTAATPLWALIENVPMVPDVHIDGYRRQRIDVRGTEVGLRQLRIRHFQFFHRDGPPIAVPRRDTPARCLPTVTATDGRRAKARRWPQFCRLQGLDTPPTLTSFTRAARYEAVGNGVPIPMGTLLANAIRTWQVTPIYSPLCVCGCGRVLHGKQIAATTACRKRLERRRPSHTSRKEPPCTTDPGSTLF